MIEIIFCAVLMVGVLAVLVWCGCGVTATRYPPMPRRYSPPNPVPEFQARPKVAIDKKQRREFSVFYANGSCRGGVLYREGNIMMNDGELFSRLDQLVGSRVVGIAFDGNDHLFKPTVLISKGRY